MTTKLSHPFMRQPDTIDIPADKVKDVDELFQWIKEQPRFPNFSKNHAYLFLYACFWDKANAKKALQKYCHLHAISPELFKNRDPMLPAIQNILNVAQMVAMPNQTPEGYNILIYRLLDTEPSKIHFAEAVKAFAMFNDVRISEDGHAKGYIVVFDMKGLRLGHLARIQLGPMRVFMSYIQEAHPVRLKKVYVVHTASFINQIMILVKPLIKSELLSLLHFTTQGPLEIFAKELLPEDYGGTLETIESFYKKERSLIENNYREWLIDSAELKEKPKTSGNDSKSIDSDVQPMASSFNALEID